MTDVTDKRTRRKKVLRASSKYDPKFTKELLSGIRYKKKLSVVELCRRWRITRQTYWNWTQNYKEFADAAELAELDYASYWHKVNKDVAEGKKKGNSQLIALALANVDGINWTTKVDVHNTSDEVISTININVLPSQPLPIESTQCISKSCLPIEHKPEDVVDGEIVSNVVQLKND